MAKFSINKVVIAGNLGADPDVRYRPNGDAVVTARIATSKRYKDQGEWKEVTEWHTVKFFRKLGEIAAARLQKGTTAYVEGELHTRKWQDKDGQNRFSTEIYAHELQVLDKGKKAAPAGDQGGGSNASENAGGGEGESWRFGPAPGDFEDDLPY